MECGGEPEAQICGREGAGLGYRDFIGKWVKSEPSFASSQAVGGDSTFSGVPSPLSAPFLSPLLPLHPPDFGPSPWLCLSCTVPMRFGTSLS